MRERRTGKGGRGGGRDGICCCGVKARIDNEINTIDQSINLSIYQSIHQQAIGRKRDGSMRGGGSERDV
jgi:hypothetical protein